MAEQEKTQVQRTALAEPQKAELAEESSEEASPWERFSDSLLETMPARNRRAPKVTEKF